MYLNRITKIYDPECLKYTSIFSTFCPIDLIVGVANHYKDNTLDKTLDNSCYILKLKLSIEVAQCVKEVEMNIQVYWVLSKEELEENKANLVEAGDEENDNEGLYESFANPIPSKAGTKPIYCLEFRK